MDSEDLSYLALRYNPQRKLMRVVWRAIGDRADQYRLFKLDE